MSSAAEQYREIVRHYVVQGHAEPGHAHSGQLSPTARRILDQQRSHLKLLSHEAAAIERSVLAATQPAFQPSQQPVEGISADDTCENDTRADDTLAEGISAVTNPAIAPVNQETQAATIASAFPDPIYSELHTEDPLFPELQAEEVPSLFPELQAPERQAEDVASLFPDPSPSESPIPFAADTPDQEAAARYQAAFAQAIRLQFPLDEVLKLGLRSLQQTLNLSDPQVEAIELRSLEDLETEQQQYKLNLEQYREEFASSRAFLYSESVQDELWTLQRQLRLRSEDVLKLERDVMKEAKRETYRDSFPTIVDSSALAEIQALENQIKQELFQTDSEPDAKATQSLVPLSHAEPERWVPDMADSPETDSHAAGRAANSPQQQAGAAANGELDAMEQPNPAEDAEPIVLSELEQAFQELEQHLGKGGPLDWWEADQTTFEILLKLAPLEPVDWLNMEAIAQITQTDALQRIDRLWSEASQGRFGLFAQREVYRKVVKDLQDQYQDKIKDDRLQQLYLQEFVRRIGWWDKRLQFLKFYKWLDFQTDLANHPDIPVGQFPAYWFWVIPRKYALQLGGIGFGQGGWRIDTSRLRAWINKLRSCKLEPYQK